MVEEVTWPEVAAFLERYKHFTSEKVDLRFHTFQVGFAHLKPAALFDPCAHDDR